MQAEIRAVTRDVDLRGRESDSSVIESMKASEALLKMKSEFMDKLDDKQREVDKLNAVIEATAPIPGFDVQMYKRLIIAQGENDDVDYRDKKIVDLAKKVRNLSLQLTKYQSENESLKESVHEANLLCNKLKEEAALSAGPRRSKIPLKNAPENNEELQAEAIKLLKKELTDTNKIVDDLKHKMYLQAEENKKLSSALNRELGEGVTIEQAVDGNWRGRAQQIIMLKSKVKKLESQAASGGGGAVGATGYPSATAGPKSSQYGPRGDVDNKAEHVISDMEDSRKRAIETISAEYDVLIVQKKELEHKVSSQKARIKNLESDIGQSKVEMQVVLEKTRSDDELVDLLRSEVQRLKDNLATVISKQKKDALQEGSKNMKLDGHGGLRGDRLAQGAMDNEVIAALRQELSRIERLNRNQTEQLQTQDKIIKELRSQHQAY
jgi:hypothetical protein